MIRKNESKGDTALMFSLWAHSFLHDMKYNVFPVLGQCEEVGFNNSNLQAKAAATDTM